MLGIEERVKELVCELLKIPPEDIVPEASFVNDLGADSLDQIELITAIEEEFSVFIPDEGADTLKTVNDVVIYIRDATEFIKKTIEHHSNSMIPSPGTELPT